MSVAMEKVNGDGVPLVVVVPTDEKPIVGDTSMKFDGDADAHQIGNPRTKSVDVAAEITMPPTKGDDEFRH